MNMHITRFSIAAALMLLASAGCDKATVSAPKEKSSQGKSSDTSPVAKLEGALRSGQIAWKFSEPEEIVELLGKPDRDKIETDDGGETEYRVLHYDHDPRFSVVFNRVKKSGKPWGLVSYREGNANYVERPEGKAIKLRNMSDLYKLDTEMWGLSGMDLSALDLTQEESRLREMPFDTLTKWPDRQKLPSGFDPHEILESGKNPGLGLRALHAHGIDGRGVDIAIIDQPLVPDHVEIESNLKIIAELDTKGWVPQMHGPLVTSIAAGKNCGVAPKANLYYVSMPMWEDTNRYYIQALETILELNKNKIAKIRAVSISTGMFRHYAQFDKWQTLLERAESEGVLVITCDLDATKLQYAFLRPLPKGDREKPEGYTAGTTYARLGSLSLLVPKDNCTYASHLGKDVYSYAPKSGNSMGAPWLVGLAALGFQVNPELKPAEIRKYLVESATVMPYGKVVNPKGFLEMCRASSRHWAGFM